MSTSNENRFTKLISFTIKNIDAILSIFLAIIAAIVSIFNGSLDVAIATTASVLTALSISILRDRSIREQMMQQMQNIHLDIQQLAKRVPSADNFFSKKSNEREMIIQAESEIILIQETGRLIAETNRREIVNFLKKGGRIRWVSVLDSGSISDLMAFRNANLITSKLMEGRMKNGIEMIEILANEAKKYTTRLEVRFFPYPTDITAIFKDPLHIDKRKREALIRFQGFRVTFDDKIDFTINAHDSKDTYELFYQQIENIWQASTKCLFLTGKPAVGKSTLLEKIVNVIRNSVNLKIMGFITRDVKNSDNERIAFETTTLDNEKTGRLALKQENGTYELNNETMNTVIIPTLLEGIESADLLIIDEIGPIQLQSIEFQHIISSILEKRHISIIGIVALQGHPYVSEVHRHYRSQLVEVTEINREQLIAELSTEFLPRKITT